MAALTAQVRTRLVSDAAPAITAPPGDPLRQEDEDLCPLADRPSVALYQALHHLTADADHTYHFGVPGAFRMVLMLLTEVLVLRAAMLDQDEEDLVRLIQATLTPELARYIAQRLPS